MRGDRVIAQTFREMVGDALGETAGVDKDERGAVLPYQLGHTPVDFFPHLVGSNRAKFAGRYLDREIDLALMADLHDERIRAVAAGEKMGDEFNGLLRGG